MSRIQKQGLQSTALRRARCRPTSRTKMPLACAREGKHASFKEATSNIGWSGCRDIVDRASAEPESTAEWPNIAAKAQDLACQMGTDDFTREDGISWAHQVCLRWKGCCRHHHVWAGNGCKLTLHSIFRYDWHRSTKKNFHRRYAWVLYFFKSVYVAPICHRERDCGYGHRIS